MKARTHLFKFLLAAMTLTTSLYMIPCLMAADVENCDLCHKYAGLGRIDESGKKHLYYVNEVLCQQTVHRKIRCKECHSDIEKYPHPNPEKVDCSTVCHLVDPSTDKKFSHANMIEGYEMSVHGKGPEDNLKEHPEDLPTCTYCHENRIYQPVSGLAEGHRGVAQEILDRCLGCHTDEQWTRYFYNHFTHRLHQRRSSERMVELCTSCHEDDEMMERHGLIVTGTFHDTFHWQSIKYGDPNAPNCITCHAPVGYSSHEIMSKDDPRSAIHKDNLVRTCSNQGGLQTCHPNATTAFAQGRIHPTRYKTGVFETKMRSFQSLFTSPASAELTGLEYYQQLFLQLIKLFYMILIGGLIGFMILHQILDYFATRREMEKGGLHK